MNTIYITIDKKKKEYNFASNWDDVTVEVYKNLNSLVILDSHTELQKRVMLVSVFLGLDFDFIYEYFSIDDLIYIESKLDFLKDKMELENLKSIEVDDDLYYLYDDFKTLKTGEVITIETLIKESNGNLLSVYDKLLCIFLRKADDEGELEPFKLSHLNRAKRFSKLPIAKVHSLMVFFSNIEDT